MGDAQEKIGIWGFGTVGKAAARYFSHRARCVEILDARVLRNDENELVRSWGATAYVDGGDTTAIEAFLARNDRVLVSPGIDIRSFDAYRDKFIGEIDVFQRTYDKPIIAVTGSVGKTTVTTLLAHILNACGRRWWVGGNIGTCMLDALDPSNDSDGAVLEISSYQLEVCRTWSPDCAIITNVHPNHLDRHENFQKYRAIKTKIFAQQRPGAVAVLPLELRNSIEGLGERSPASPVYFFCANTQTKSLVESPDGDDLIFFIADGHVIVRNAREDRKLAPLSAIPCTSFVANWLVVYAALFAVGVQPRAVKEHGPSAIVPAHRLEKIATLSGVEIYNDSKATTAAATRAAVEKLAVHPLILMVGGLSKGVDRGSELVATLKGRVKLVVCFGAEHACLAHACHAFNVPCKDTLSLDEAFALAIASACPGDVIALSPAGSSFDQFKDYEARGTYFKRLVHNAACAASGAAEWPESSVKPLLHT